MIADRALRLNRAADWGLAVAVAINAFAIVLNVNSRAWVWTALLIVGDIALFRAHPPPLAQSSCAGGGAAPFTSPCRGCEVAPVMSDTPLSDAINALLDAFPPERTQWYRCADTVGMWCRGLAQSPAHEACQARPLSSSKPT